MSQLVNQGKFIVIEGTDGSGKGTQFQRLVERLTSENIAFETVDFPQYGQPSAYFVEQYLNGNYGTLDDIGPYRGSVFYAVDRYQASFTVRQALQDGKWVIGNRYVGSNMGHQGAKIASAAERKTYFTWLTHFEFEIMGIPKPDLNIVLHMPAEQAQQLVDQKAERAYIKGKKRDLHEDDLDHLQKAERVYLEMCDLFPSEFTKIECAPDGGLLSIDAVAEAIWQNVAPLLH